jgi:hypothetical protein
MHKHKPPREALGEQRAMGVRRLRGLLLSAVIACGGGAAVWTVSAGAADLTRFELDDGTVIVGEALGLANGVYRIRTRSLGDIDVEAERIRRMARASAGGGVQGHADGNMLGDDAFGAAGNNAAPAGYASTIQDLQQRMVGDSGIMESIIALQGDPELQRAIQDPELIGLITSGNVEALRNHAGFGRLMDHPGIRAIIEQLTDPGGSVP